jgi:beta-lactamase class A
VKPWVAIVALAFVAQQPPAVPAPIARELRGKFDARLQEIARGLDGVMGYSIVDLTTGERIEAMASTEFATASTIKLAILYELLKQNEEGRIRLTDERRLDRRAVVNGDGILHDLTTPSLSIRDYAALMITLSDNTATNVVIDIVGMEAVNTRMRALGLGHTRLRRKMIDLAAARRGDENVSTPQDLARLMTIVSRGEGLTPASRDEALGLLKKGRTSYLRRGLPPGVQMASKYGDLDGIRADVGFVPLEDRPFVVSVMTGLLQDEAAGEQAIAAVARAAYEYFNRLATATAYGRLIK